METYKEEALKAKEIAERRFSENDFASAKSYALKAKSLYPELEGISQMVATFEVYVASEVKINGMIDYHLILGLKPSADRKEAKKQYRKLAILLHPDDNKSIGAYGAFKLVSEAWTYLSDVFKQTSLDLKRKKHMASEVVQTNSSAFPGFRHDTFWTVCTSCKVQYEYLRKYVNKRLSCKNCRGTFIAVETGPGPMNGSFSYCSWSGVPYNGYGGHRYDTIKHVPTSSAYLSGNGPTGYHSGHGYDYRDASYQWSSYSGTSSANGDNVYQSTNRVVRRGRPKTKCGVNGTYPIMSVAANTKDLIASIGDGEPSGYYKAARAGKKRKVGSGEGSVYGCDENGSNYVSDTRTEDSYLYFGCDHKLSHRNGITSKRYAVAPAFDAKKILIGKARTEIQKKLQEMRSVSQSKDNENIFDKGGRSAEGGLVSKRGSSNIMARQLAPNKNRPTSISVPDPDFHDFDKGRSEECFMPKQIWAIYDDDDGMPRLYCLIREVVSVQPFKVHITYLNSKTDSEFGTVNWIDSGFTKSCGHFRCRNSDVVEQVNIFSHLLKDEKARRGGCVRIFPKNGDIWALYRNWSTDWNWLTPDDIRHQYEMVEVLEAYSEELGVSVASLVKVPGFKTVYKRVDSKDSVRWIPRREMLRFSHQVPSFSLKEELSNNLPPGQCWELDPAATPDELLNSEAEEPGSKISE